MAPDSSSGGYLALEAMPGYAEIEDVLHDVITGITGLPPALVRPRWQVEPPREPEKTENWCAFGVVASDPENYPHIRHFAEDEGYDRVVAYETLTVLLSFYGPLHAATARRMRLGIHVPQNRALLRPNNMAFVRAGAGVPVPGRDAVGWLPRTDLTLYFTLGTGSDVAVRNVLKTAGTLENQNGVTSGFGCDGK